MKIDLIQKIALVTGASGELGSRHDANPRGMRCGCGGSLSPKSRLAEKAQTEIASSSQRANVVQADLTDPAAIQTMRAAVEPQLGPVDILVNNAVVQYT